MAENTIAKMGFKQIFNSYFKRKLIFWSSLTLIGFVIRYWNRPIEWELTGWFYLFVLFIVVFTGFLDYRFYEKNLPKIIAKLLASAPLTRFAEIGFEYEDEKLVGVINDFKVFLSPYADSSGLRFLIILIPVEPREGLEQYFKSLNGTFNLSFDGESLVYAKAILKNYNKEFDFDKLFDLINSTILFLKKKSIEPLEIAEDEDINS